MMNVEEIREYCLQKPGVTESLPFGDDTLVFKTVNKIFLLIGLQSSNCFNVKCNPELAVELREHYTEVQPGFHMNKTHWNTVYTDGQLTRRQLCDMIDHSYQLIVNSLPKKLRAELQAAE